MSQRVRNQETINWATRGILGQSFYRTDKERVQNIQGELLENNRLQD